MPITSVDSLDRSLRNITPIFYSKANRTGANPGEGTHHWISTGIPGAGAYPSSTPTACSHLTTGAIPFIQQQAPRKTYLAGMSTSMTLNNTGLTLELRDRLVHTPTVTPTGASTQAVNCDLNTFLASENIDARKGPADFSEVIWSYESIGTHSNSPCDATINVTYNDGTTGDLITFSVQFLSTTRNISLAQYIPAANQGKYIRGINSITYSAVLAGGSAAFSAARYLGSANTELNLQEAQQTIWETALIEIHNNSCLFLFSQFNGSDTGVVTGQIRFVHG